jgi:hypothetical protein
MADKVNCELWIAMNEDKGWIVTQDESEALEKLMNDEGGWHCRIAKITVSMSPPVMAEAKVDVPADTGQTVQASAA